MLRNKIYYQIKPLIPWSVRMGIRRWFAQRKRAKVWDVWPIRPGIEMIPRGWAGWPEGKQFAFVLSHDVEGQRGLDRCRQLMEAERELGFFSSFNFIPEGQYHTPKALRDELTRNGFEVGIHDLRHDGKLYQSREEFLANARRINHYVKEWNVSGFRSGFMHHNLDWLQELDVRYDASTFDTDPFEPQPDAAGTIFPFWVRGTQGRKGYMELPYTLPQDSTMFLLFREKTINIWKKKLDWVAEKGGMVLVNTHPDYMDFRNSGRKSAEFPVRLYQELLCYVKEKYAGRFYHALPREVAEFAEKAVRAPAVDSEPARVAPARTVLAGKRAAVVLYSDYPFDPRPRREAEALAEAGMAVDLICIREEPSEKVFETVNGVNIYRVPLRRRRSGKWLYFLQYSYFLSVCAWILALRSLKYKYSLVHVHNMPDVLVFSAIAPKIRGAKVILDLHDPMPELLVSIFNSSSESSLLVWLKRLEKWSIAFADLVLTPNTAFQNLFVSRSCEPEKIRIVMNSPESAIFSPSLYPSKSPGRAAGKKTFRLMYHGLLVERHGLDMAIEAVNILRESIPCIEFHIYGGLTPYMEKMSVLIRELGLDQVVTYHGSKSQPVIAETILDIDLGVIPNRRTPFTEINMPTRIFEYLAMGRPVIVPRTKGILEYFGEDELIFFEPDEPGDLAAKMKWAFLNPAELRAMLDRAEKKYQNYTWEAEKSRFLSYTGGLFAPAGK